ncbi:MAG: hypothetical protein N3E47_07055 [Candidatus Bathyarchaeota archaeon]|nr:hypothetical protein [Candidatus Bathyarchaeota archaeon]
MSDAMLNVLRSERLQRVLKALKDGFLNSMDPVIGFSSGVEYPALQGFFSSTEEANEALSLLSEIGLLRSEIVDNVAVCPVCQSHRLMVRMRCPSCSSSRLVRGAMIEHLSCGHIDFEERFKGGEGLVCPRCGKPLGPLGVDYRTFSFLYRCLGCRSVFSSPKIEHLCSNGHSFGGSDLTIQVVRAFKFNPEKSFLLERLIFDLEVIFKPLRSEGLIVESPAEVYGETGVKHDFSFAIWDGVDGRSSGLPPVIVGSTHTSESVVTAVDVLAFWAKAVDAGAKHKFMIALGGVDKGGRDLAEVYGIRIIEGRSSSEVIDKARAMIGEALESVRREKESAPKGEKPQGSSGVDG